MTNKKVTIPEPQLMTVEYEGQPGKRERKAIDFKTAAVHLWMTDRRWGANIQNLTLCQSIKEKVLESNGTMTLTHGEWVALRTIAESPQQGYDPRDSAAVLTFYRALAEAEDLSDD